MDLKVPEPRELDAFDATSRATLATMRVSTATSTSAPRPRVLSTARAADGWRRGVATRTIRASDALKDANADEVSVADGEDGAPRDASRGGASCASRRSALTGAMVTACAAVMGTGRGAEWAEASGFGEESESLKMTGAPDYALTGPYRVRVLPQLEHTCSKCFPACTGLSCLSRIKVYVPRVDVSPDALFPIRTTQGGVGKDGSSVYGASEAPYPVAIITPGFLIDGDSYASIARRLCSWGYVVVAYTKTESVAGGTLDDEVSTAILDDLISWVGSDVLISPYADANQVYLIGHSRGGKISMLQATRDERVKAVCLLDPVDNTIYAPLGVGYPSALAAMKLNPSSVPPVAVIGSENGGECAPSGSNYVEFFDASPRGLVAEGHLPWGLSCGAGHFDFIDEATFVQKVICPDGTVDASVTRDLSAAIVVAHGERVFRPAADGDDAVLNRTLASLRSQWIDRELDFSSVTTLQP